MSKIKLHRPKAFERPDGLQWDAPSSALDRWAGMPFAAEADNPDTISIYEIIGEDFWTGEGVTAKRIAGALRAIGNKDVTVNINSPGGDVIEGLAIYNLLAEHPGAVHVRVMGIAASAASIIAMAGDKIEMGLGSFLMIHNCWGMCVGNQHDMRIAADMMSEIDGALADVYVHRTGNEKNTVQSWMDDETYMSASAAVERGFADGTFDSPKTTKETPAASVMSARRRLDAMLAQQGVPRSERRKMLRDAAGMQDAAGTDTPSAVALDPALFAETLTLLKS